MPGLPTTTELQSLGRKAGLAAVGVTSADVLFPAANVLKLRKSSGLSSGMQFTYRNPDRSSSPQTSIGYANSLVAGAYGYFQGERRDTQPGEGEIARYAWNDYYSDLEQALGVVADALTGAGARARVIADSNALVDRNVAWRAGLGWYGKNANLLLPDHGSWFVLGAVVTDAELAPTGPPLDDQCGACSACLTGCPTNAILAPGVIDARRCLAWIVQAGGEIPIQYREAVGARIYGCDDCQEVCPPNRSANVTEELDHDGLVDLLWILESGDQALLERYGRWYIADRDCDVIRRTALVALGNSADSPDKVTDILKRYLKHKNPLLRGHAAWAARRLGLDFLVKNLEDDPEPSVRRELVATVESRYS